MNKNLNIFSSSFLIPNNPSWQVIAKNFKLNFKLLSQLQEEKNIKQKEKILVSIFFSSDVLEEFHSSFT